MNEYAILAKQAYNYNSPVYEPIPNWLRMGDFSDSYNTTFINHQRKEIVIAIRGTDPSKLGDLISDGMILANTLERSPHYNHAKRRLLALHSKFQPLGYSITLVGHSLGGSVAQLLGRRYPEIRTITFNAGQGPSQFGESLKDKLLCKVMRNKDACRNNISQYSTGLDPISVLGVLNNRNVGARGGLDTHGVGNFTKKN